MNGQTVVRVGEAGDIPAVLELWRAADTRPSVTDDPAGLGNLLSIDPGALLVAEHGGRVVGTLIATFDGWRGNMYRLAVAPRYRRRGIARSLVDAAEARLRAIGVRRVSALVVREHAGASEFWSRAGYGPDLDIGRFSKSF